MNHKMLKHAFAINMILTLLALVKWYECNKISSQRLGKQKWIKFLVNFLDGILYSCKASLVFISYVTYTYVTYIYTEHLQSFTGKGDVSIGTKYPEFILIFLKMLKFW